MDRRTFLASGLAGAVAARKRVSPARGQVTAPPTGSTRRFKLKYAPHFGMFKHHAGEDLLDQLKFAADQGFTAWEDNGMAGRPVEVQEQIAGEMQRLGLAMGVFVAYADFGAATFVKDDKDVQAMLVGKMKAAVEVAKRVNARWTTVVLGCYEPRMDWGYQTANAIEHLRAGAEVCEPAGLVMVLEPLNPRDHPNLFLTKISQAYEICRAVGSPACKILDDLYHQQVTEGNLIPNLEAAWREIAYIQLGDNPGRKEPTTGEINFRNVFRYLHNKNYPGILGMEHGISREGQDGERALIEAYAACDSF